MIPAKKRKEPDSQRAEMFRIRTERIRAYLAEHPGATRRSILADVQGRKRCDTGTALATMLKRGSVVPIDAPDGTRGYVLKEHRNRIRWTIAVDPSPQQEAEHG